MWPSLYCYHATKVTARVSLMGDTIYDLDWFEYPIKLQKLIVLTIARSQKPGKFSGLDLIDCTLEALTKVSNISFQ